MESQLEEQGCDTLFPPPQRVSGKVVKAFYAAIHPQWGDSIRVQGKVVDFSPKSINTHLGLSDIVDAERRRPVSMWLDRVIHGKSPIM